VSEAAEIRIKMGTSMPAFLFFFSCILSGNIHSRQSGLRNILHHKGGLHRSIFSMAKVGLEELFISKVGLEVFSMAKVGFKVFSISMTGFKLHIFFYFEGGLGSI
jgi:hypothetical protein